MLETTLAISSLVAQSASMFAGIGGLGASRRAGRAQRRAIRAEGQAQLRDLTRERSAVLGTQRAAYAGANVAAGVGSARLVQAETRSDYARQQALTAYLTRQRERGAQAGQQAARTQLAAGFASDLSSMAQFAYSWNRDRPVSNANTP